MGGIEAKIRGGAFGVGLAEHVREAYNFLAINYSPGDEIFLVGFSRGAFTARSVAGLISYLGLLTRDGLPWFSEVYTDYQHRNERKYRPEYPDEPFRNKPSAGDPRYVDELERRGLTRLDIPIKAIGVFETVGALGIPRSGLLEMAGLQEPPREMSFYDTALSSNVENAFQGLALDEQRRPFKPALWEKPRGCTTRLKQVWFPGVHANVGGGYADQELSDITLAWMISLLEDFLSFYEDFTTREEGSNKPYYRKQSKPLRPWSFGKIYDSLTGLYRLTSPKTRTPGAYRRTDPEGRGTGSGLLRNTNEFIHPCVRARVALRGPGTGDEGDYDPKALRDWDYDYRTPPGRSAKELPLVVWRKVRDKDRDDGQDEIPESILAETEWRLLERKGSEEVRRYLERPLSRSTPRRRMSF